MAPFKSHVTQKALKASLTLFTCPIESQLIQHRSHLIQHWQSFRYVLVYIQS